MDMYERRSGAGYLILGIIGIMVLGIGFFFIARTETKPTVSTVRCESITDGTYTMFQSSPGFGTMVAFDSLKKPCTYNPQKETWEPLVYVAPPAAEAPAKP